MYMYMYMHMLRDMPGLREPMVLWALKPFGPWPYKHVEYFGPAGPPPIAKSPKCAHVLFVFGSQLLAEWFLQVPTEVGTRRIGSVGCPCQILMGLVAGQS